MKSQIKSIGLASPGKPIPQELICSFMQKAHDLDAQESRKLAYVYRKSGITQRYSVLEDFKFSNVEDFRFFPKNKRLEPFPTTDCRMEVFRQVAPQLASEAIEKCLEKSKLEPNQITHLILISCTGMYAPGVEMDIIERMGFASNVERYAIHFMGCYAAFNGIKMADRICKSEPSAKVLVLSVELCTLHFQKEYNEDNILANALFGDGAAAVLIAQGEQGLQIEDYESNIIPDGADDMAWAIGNFGFQMKLSKYIPGLLEKGIKQFSEGMEKKFGLSGIKHFAIHPGGKQILNKVEAAFGIEERRNKHAHQVLKDFGNMSSVTILFVLEAILRDATIHGKILAMGFGPGLTLESLLISKS
ncbi:type III polyketide synthase [Cyclobacterium marinum]|uniref:Chalcone and stilbene synthase domain protein n=1 Tax=Cyclobacterium marinum (strain ATCC 25205 / DSM 745 / LMG 13164 / NCIMB 1802) TaxID=880070 RepID=G0IVZ4_CYCMS|nr:type III polyketide synthase [Cyclobacterium marinum]AEL25539.1 chalcone and stilbene synthase domain protein [Cyclobacterium marinum DSM 745]MBI0400973.1 type III polyketide synthase [Cyclobacterium marinum]